MKLTAKITLIFILTALLVMALNGFAWLRREEQQFDDDVRRDAVTFGTPLAHAVERLGRLSEDEAARVVHLANSRLSSVRVHWVSLGRPLPFRDMPQLPLTSLSDVAAGQVVQRESADSQGNPWLFTYIPLAKSGENEGRAALEIQSSLTGRSRFLESTRQRVITVTGILALAVSMVSAAFGAIFVARPLTKLIGKIRRIEQGDLSAPLVLRQRDEFAEVAKALNAMCEGLERSRQALLAETAARVTALEQLRHADRLTTVGRLAAGLAHEIGTPLAVVAGRAQMIALGETSGDETRENAQIVVQQTERIASIIRQLLDFARKRPPQKAPADLVSLACKMRNLLEPIASKRRVELHVVADESEPVAAEVDVGQLEQVITNLVMNAVQATPRGGKTELRVGRDTPRPSDTTAEPPKAYIYLAVADTGSGMDEKTREHIFEPFFTTKDVGEGTGLGLPVAHGIVEEHGGFIHVTSELGKGSTFTVYLPAMAASKQVNP